MPRFALIKAGQLSELRTLDARPVDIPHKQIVWLPADPVAAPAHDPDTERLVGPSYSIGASAVTESWEKVALTAQELDAMKDAKVAALDKVQFRIMFNHENRIRALQGQAAITQPQFLAAIKALL